MSPRTACIECGATLAERRIAGEPLAECPSCGALRVSREALNRLRTMPPSAHALLAETAPRPPDAKARIKRCPTCQGSLLSHTFGGGNVRVDTCEACDVVHLGRSGLAAIVKEAHQGIEMSDEAQAVLHEQRMLAAGNRFTAAEIGLSTVLLTALVAFFRIVLRVGFTVWTIAAAGVIALGVLVFLQWKWRRQKREAAEKMDRLAAAELFRLEQKEREEARREAAPRAPITHEPSASSRAPRDSAPVPSNDARAAARSSRPRLCPVCRAKLPAGTTHCASCDSDFG